MIRVRRIGDVTQLAMARTVFGRPLYVACAYYLDGLLLDDSRAALQRKLDFMERLRDEARERQAKGLDPARIRQELLGGETWWPVLTSGHFSKQNLIDALLRDLPCAA